MDVSIECEQCHKTFSIDRNRFNDRKKKSVSGTIFCSWECYKEFSRLNRIVVEEPIIGKVCHKCGDPISQAEASYRESHKIRGYCRKCLCAYQCRRWNRRKAKAVEFLGGKCNRCSRTGHPVIFDFHHRESDDKEFDWARLRRKSWDKITKELEKCELLCSICHRLHHIKPESWEFTEES
jgi:hypothetical protein